MISIWKMDWTYVQRLYSREEKLVPSKKLILDLNREIKELEQEKE
jgi:hypothetical protein